MIKPAPLSTEVSTKSSAWIQWFQNMFKSLQGIDVSNGSTFESDVTINGNIIVNGNTGLTETLTFGGGASGEVATITFNSGIATSRTLVP